MVTRLADSSEAVGFTEHPSYVDVPTDEASGWIHDGPDVVGLDFALGEKLPALLAAVELALTASGGVDSVSDETAFNSIVLRLPAHGARAQHGLDKGAKTGLGPLA